jgi:hypothetical protein
VVLLVMASTFGPNGVVVTVWVAMTSICAACIKQGIKVASARSAFLVVNVGFMDCWEVLSVRSQSIYP